jgi:DNA repair exonuclease SbcCD ATPase subunit
VTNRPVIKRPTYWEGVKEAFLEKGNVAVLAGASLPLLISNGGPLSTAYVAGLLAVGAAEVCWLMWAPFLPAYQQRLRVKRHRRIQAEKERDRKRVVSDLTPELGTRYQEVRRLYDDIRQGARDSGSVANDLLAEELDKLDALLDAFLRLLCTWLRYRRYLNRTDENAIVKDIAHLRGKLERTGDSDTQRIIRQNLDILEKRLERIEAIQKGYLNLQAQLEVIEDTFHLINDQMVSLRTPDALGIDLNQIVSGVEMTEAVLQETNALIADQYMAAER